MFCGHNPLGFMRSLVVMALLGFAVIVLIGPALGVVGTLLPFAIIGGLSWAGYRFGRRTLAWLRGERRFQAIDREPRAARLPQTKPAIRPIVVQAPAAPPRRP